MHIYDRVDLGIGIFLSAMCLAVVIQAVRGRTRGMSKLTYGWFTVWIVLSAAISLLAATHLHGSYAYKGILDIARLVAVAIYIVCSIRQQRQASPVQETTHSSS